MIKENISKEHMAALEEFGLGDIDLSNLHLLKYQCGEFICLQGNEFTYLFIFLGGKAKIYFTSADGKTLLVDYYIGLGLICDLELMRNENTVALSVQAITQVTCIGIPLNIYKDYLKSNLDFMSSVGRELANKMRSSTTKNIFNILHTLDARLCAHISMTNKDGYFKEKLTELAEYMGTSYRHLLRTLQGLCEDEVLEKTKKGYFIKDEKALYNRSREYYEA